MHYTTELEYMIIIPVQCITQYTVNKMTSQMTLRRQSVSNELAIKKCKALREFKSREVAQAPIYVIVHSLLELSLCTRPFPTPSGWLCRCVLTLVMAFMALYKFCIIIIIFTFLRPQILRKRLRVYHLGHL